MRGTALPCRTPGHLDHGGAGDAGEGGGDLGFVDHAVLDHEEVLAGTFGHEAVGVEQQRLVVAGFDGFGVGEDGVGVGGRQLARGIVMLTW
jgi:hypothetical protein